MKAEKRLGVDLKFDRSYESGQIRVIQEGQGVFSRVVVHAHPHDYMWIVFNDDHATAHSMVMMDIHREIDRAVAASAFNLERMHHPDWELKETILGTHKRWTFVGGPTFDEVKDLDWVEFHEKYTFNKNISLPVYDGFKELWKWTDCIACQGTGEVTSPRHPPYAEGTVAYEDCPVCDGRGSYYERKEETDEHHSRTSS